MRTIVFIGLALLCVGCSIEKKWPLVIVLGIDGMDPKFVEAHISDLPNLHKLMAAGEFKRLQTTMPPQSPVAWSTFSTGLDPAQHGLFDFVYRDPKTGKPFSAMGETDEPAHSLNIGLYTLPLGAPHIRSFRHGTVFWKLLADAGVPTKILRMPVNYPPEKSKAIAVSGMGVPDMRGTFGTFTFFTDNPSESRRAVSGGQIVPVRAQGDRYVLNLAGPPNPYLRTKASTSVSMTVDVDPFESVARFKIQDHMLILRAGEWSEWVPIEFSHANGMVRIFAKGFRPDFEVYVSSVNFNPAKPDAVISNPPSESARIASRIGLFYTQGMAEDTAAYRNGVFSREEYLVQARTVANEQISILKHELLNFTQGFLFLHFSGVDQNSHMLWGKFDQDLLSTYKLVDDTIGWVRQNHPDAKLIVMSDHGFNSFRRSVNLNAWLLQQSLSKTAYALGLNGFYLNIAGREKDGTIARADAPKLLLDIEAKLLRLRDPVSGKQVIARVYAPHPNFHGDIELIPDLIIGYAPGYRSSWEGDLGNSAGPVLADNTDPGLAIIVLRLNSFQVCLISNLKSNQQNPRLKDLTVSLLSLFNIKPAEGMDGHIIY